MNQIMDIINQLSNEINDLQKIVDSKIKQKERYICELQQNCEHDMVFEYSDEKTHYMCKNCGTRV